MKNTQHKKRLRLKGFDYTGQFRYSLTFCTKDKTAYFDDAFVVSGIAGFLREASEKHGFRIWSFCFMPDHLHVLVEGERPSSDLRKFASLFKQKSGHWFRRHYSKNGGQGFSPADNSKNVGQGFSPANHASLKACPTNKDQATLKGCPTKKIADPDMPATLMSCPQEEMVECKDLWQINYYEHVLRSEEATEKVARYIIDNPVRKGLVPGFRDYPFSWCDVLGFVGQGFSSADNASLKACSSERHKDNVGQGFSPANHATLKGCPTKKIARPTACSSERHKDDVGQGFSPADADPDMPATLKGCPTKKIASPTACSSESHKDDVGQGFSPADNASFSPADNASFSPADNASLKACPTKKIVSNHEGLPCKSSIGGTPNSKGFTLVEIVITIVLVSILSGIAAMIILQGVRAYSDERSRSDVHYQARIAMERMAREIRVIRSAADITTLAATNLLFTDVNGATVGFEWIIATKLLNRWNGASNDVLANGINSFSFTYLRSDGTPAVLAADVWFIQIDMTSVQGTESLPMRTRVHPRNF